MTFKWETNGERLAVNEEFLFRKYAKSEYHSDYDDEEAAN